MVRSELSQGMLRNHHIQVLLELPLDLPEMRNFGSASYGVYGFQLL